jgi:hypothetical protein
MATSEPYHAGAERIQRLPENKKNLLIAAYISRVVSSIVSRQGYNAPVNFKER